MSNLLCKRKKDKINYILAFSGIVDETVTFPEWQELEKNEIVFDLDGIDLINSTGIARWIKWIEEKPKDKTMIFRRIPKIIVDQMNAVQGFIATNTKIESFYCPFYFEENDTTSHILLSKIEHFDTGSNFKLNLPKPKHPTTKEEGQLDVIEEKYFSFLQKI